MDQGHMQSGMQICGLIMQMGQLLHDFLILLTALQLMDLKSLLPQPAHQQMSFQEALVSGRGIILTWSN